MASQIADIVLFGWPLAVFYLFKRFDLPEALCYSVIFGYLFVPQLVGFDLPLVPPYDKELVVNVSAAVMCMITMRVAMRPKVRGAAEIPAARLAKMPAPKQVAPFVVQRGQILFWSLLAVLFCSTIITTMDNGEPLVRGTRILSGMRPYDILSVDMAILITITPFLLARRYLSTPESHVILLKVLVIACLCYSLLALWEMRMSPRLNRQIYGFVTHEFRQAVRGDAYRPLVFLNHGLWLAIFFAMSSLGAMALWREKLRTQEASKWFFASVYLLVVLSLCSSLGALIITILLLPLIFLFGPAMQLFLAACVSVTILVYPVLRGSDLVPTQAIYNAAARIDVTRAESLLFRFDNEDELLAHANRKPLAGWGTWGRNRVFNEKGGDIAATDGYWVIIVGVYGWLGYIAQFGLMGIATILLAMNRKRLQVSPATAGVAMVMAAAMIDLIPNATTSPVLWLFAGALMGRYQTAEAAVKQTNIRNAAKMRNTGARPPATPAEEDLDEARPAGTATDRPLHQRRPREG